MDRPNSLWIAFLALWALSQLLIGAVTPWVLGATALALAALCAFGRVLLPGGPRLSNPAAIYLWGALAIFALQILPLGFLFPATRALRDGHGSGALWPGSADLFLTVRCLVQFLVYALSALLVLELRSAGLSPSRMLGGVLAVLALQAATAVAQKVGGWAEIPFYGPRESLDSASGTFVNRNTLGGVLAMGVVLGAAQAYARLARGRSAESGIAWALVTTLFALGIVLSKSRGGAMGALVGLLLLPLLYRGGPRLAAAGAVVLAGGLGVMLADPSVLLERFGELGAEGLRENSRYKIWSATAWASLDQPLLGFGIGTYPYAFHPYQPPSMMGEVHHAHNEYVNFLFEGGVAWLLLQVAGLGVWAQRSQKGSPPVSGPDRVLRAAVPAAVFAEAVHSLVDFDLRVTSAGMLLAVLVGLGGSAESAGAKPRRALGAILLALGVLSPLALLFLPLDSEARLREAAVADKAQARSLCLEALGLSPYNFRASWMLARASEEQPDRALAARRYQVAADLWPAHAGLQRDVGLWFFIRYVESGEATDLERSARSYRRLFEQRPDLVEETLAVLWQKSRPVREYETLLPGTPQAAARMAGFLVRKGRWREAMEIFKRDCPETAANAPIFDGFAEKLEQEGQWGLGAWVRDRRLKFRSDPGAHARAARAWGRLEAYDRAVEQVALARRLDPGNPRWASLAGDLERQAGHLDRALEAYVDAIRMAPLEVDLLAKRASLYEDMKLYSSAAEDYWRGLRARPRDRDLTFGLVRALVAQGDRAKAQEALEEYLKEHPADPAALGLKETLQK